MLPAGSSCEGQGEHPGLSPFDAVSSNRGRGGAGKFLLGTIPPIFEASPTPKPGVWGNCPNPTEDEAALSALLSPKWCLSPIPVPVCSKPAVFCPNPAPAPSPARHTGKGSAAPRKNQAGRNRRRRCPPSDATSPRVPIPGRGWEPGGGGGTAWGGPPVSSLPSIPLWMGGLGSETSRVGWMCRSQLRFRDSCRM